jgi:hypothetical protein
MILAVIEPDRDGQHAAARAADRCRLQGVLVRLGQVHADQAQAWGAVAGDAQVVGH